jgi:quercetin dioxygenase-like cupin family protein
MVKRLVLMVVSASWLASPAFAAEPEVFDVGKELSTAAVGRRTTNVSLVKMPDYTVNAVAVKDEIPLHRHDEGTHVLYIVSGRGTAMLGGKPVPLKPGTIVHIPQGVDHSIKPEGGEMVFVDFVRHATDPARTDKK